MKFNILLLFLCFLLFKQSASAQHQADNWLFGQNAGLHFNSDGSVSSFSGSAMNTPQGSASISDKQGNLLFYSDGETVWNRQHQVMANGNGLIGDKTVKQPCIIILKPGSNTLYYLITHRPAPIGTIFSDGLLYHEIDMAAQNGLGEVVSNAKNVVFFSTANKLYYFISEKLTAIHHANNRDIWLIAHHYADPNTYEFLSFKISSAGISIGPVLSHVPNNHLGNRSDQGGMKVASNGKYLALDRFGGAIYSFNNQTGKVINNRLFGFNTGVTESHMMEFSPDGTKLYTTSSNSTTSVISQFNLKAGNPSAIHNSLTNLSIKHSNYSYSGIQLGPDGKIYITRNNSDSIYVINEPDKTGLACNFSSGPVLSAGSKGRFGFPNFIQSYFAPPRFIFTQSCAGSPVSFAIQDTTGMHSPRWDFGDAGSGSLNRSRSFAPDHSFSAAGTYEVSLTLYFDADSAVFTRQVIIPETPKVSLGPDTVICSGSGFTLSNKFYDPQSQNNYRWSTGDTSLTITVTKPGTYWLELKDALCPARDSIQVSFETCPQPFLPNIITPNNDGKNDTFAPKYLTKGNWHLQIFNRWGKKIYETESYRNEWPQTNIPAGTYYYLCREKTTNQKFKGWLEVVK